MYLKFVKAHGKHKRGDRAQIKEGLAERMVGQGVAVPDKPAKEKAKPAARKKASSEGGLKDGPKGDNGG